MNVKRAKPEHISSVVKNFLKELGLETAYKQHQALLLWPEVVGAGLSRVTEPVRIEYGRMYIRVTNSSWRQEVYYFKYQIIERLNKKLNEPVVKDLILV